MPTQPLDDFLCELDPICGHGDVNARRTQTKDLLQMAETLLAKEPKLLSEAQSGALYSRISGDTRIMEAGEERAVVDLVQQGGTMLGIGLLGYTYVMERLGIRFRSMAGTSAGAINTLLLAAMPEKIYNEPSPFFPGERKAVKSELLAYVVANKDFSTFLDRTGTLGKLQQGLLKRINSLNKYSKILLALLPLALLAASYGLYTALDLLIFNEDNGLRATEVNHYNFISGTVGIMVVSLFVLLLLFALFRKRMGFNPGEAPYHWMKDILATNYVGIHTTRQLLDNKKNETQPVRKQGEKETPVDTKPRLVFITANLTHNRIVKFPEQNGDYWKPEFTDLVCPAAYVRASMSLPFIFYSMVPADRYLEGKEGTTTSDSVRILARFVDGGMLSNFPIREFHVPPPALPNHPTFGVLLGKPDPPPTDDTDSIKDKFRKLPVFKFILSFISTFRNFYDADFLESHPELNMLVQPVDTKAFNSLDFGMPFETKKKLFEAGAQTAINQLNTFDWTTYLEERKKINNNI